MHLDHGGPPRDYQAFLRRKKAWLLLGAVLLATLFLFSLSIGAVRLPPGEVLRALGAGGLRWLQDLPGFPWVQDPGLASVQKGEAILWRIRLPQALAAVLAGTGLAVAGVVMQTLLRNPLASPFTLGISHAGAFGAAASVVLLGAGSAATSAPAGLLLDSPYLTTGAAFLSCLVATGAILVVSRLRGSSPEAMVLAGVAFSSLFTAGTMVLQFFSDDAQLAAVVFWSFGDLGRVTAGQLGLMAAVVAAALAFYLGQRWDYQALDAGEEVARSLGVEVARVRNVGMVVSALVTAVLVSFLGVIGFVGLVCPHMARWFLGEDHRFLLPGAALVGALLLLAADTLARVVLAPYVLPVSILTAFVGAPTFLVLLLKVGRR